MTDARLDEFDKDEWRSIAKRLKPGLSDKDYDRMWDEFQAMKRRKKLQ